MRLGPHAGATATWLAIAATVLIGATWAPPSAQSLADVARAEAARRAAVKTSGPTITDKDLKSTRERPFATTPAAAVSAADTGAAGPAGGEAPAPAAAEAGTAAGGDAPAGPPPPAPEKRDEAYWRHRFTATRQAVQRALQEAAAVEQRARQLEAELEADATPARRQELVHERDASLAALRRLQQRVANVTAELSALERLAGNLQVPADWTR